MCKKKREREDAKGLKEREGKESPKLFKEQDGAREKARKVR